MMEVVLVMREQIVMSKAVQGQKGFLKRFRPSDRGSDLMGSRRTAAR